MPVKQRISLNENVFFFFAWYCVGRQSSSTPQVTLLDMNVNFEPFASDGPVTANMGLTSTPESGVPTGPNLWHFAVYGSSQSDGSGSTKFGYTGNVLTPKQAKTSLVPGGTMNINGIRFNFNMGGKTFFQIFKYSFKKKIFLKFICVMYFCVLYPLEGYKRLL